MPHRKTSPLVIFDWDGTLMDSVPRIVSCMQTMARQAGLPVPAESAVHDIIGLSLWVALERLFGCDDKAEQQRLIAIYRQLYVHTDTTPSPLFANVREVLADLQGQGLLLAVATGKARQGLERAWQATNTKHFFSYSCCADEANSKPDAQMLQRILAASGRSPQQAVMIGDSRYDLQMANNAMVKAIGVNWGVHNNAQLAMEQPWQVIGDIRELPQRLTELWQVQAMAAE